MYVRGNGVEFSRVAEIVKAVSAEHYSGNVIVHPDAKPAGSNGYGFAGRMRCESSRGPGARRSASGRAMPVTCWHAYGRIMLAVFEEYPHAVITSSVARYEGRSDFLTKYEATAEHNIGSHAFPKCLADACDCDSDTLTD